MNTSQTHQRNAAYWNENAGWYAERDIDQDIEFLRAGGSYLMDAERELLGDLRPWCNRAIHLQCSHGRDGLSLIRQGAAEIVGIDISERLLAAAKAKSDALGAAATWVLSDVLNVPHDLDSTADLVYTGKGALCWMTDIDAWARVVERLLKPGGRAFVFEGHPLDWAWDETAPEYRLDPDDGDYFSDKPRHRLFTFKTESTPHYRQWTLGAVINSLIGAGLVIEQLTEHPEPFWPNNPHMPEDTIRRLPHTFSVFARRP